MTSPARSARDVSFAVAPRVWWEVRRTDLRTGEVLYIDGFRWDENGEMWSRKGAFRRCRELRKQYNDEWRIDVVKVTRRSKT